jgi:5-methylcytosine-specific restriction endonuclease McrA
MNAEAQIKFLRSIQRLLDEGEFVATYKLALLQALADLSVESSDNDSGGLEIPVRRISGKFAEYYWPQVAPFRSIEDRCGVLRQNTGVQASILTTLSDLRSTHGGSIASAKRNQAKWDATMRRIDATIREMPLWKLQTVAGATDEFLYRKRDFNGGAILLLPGVASHFRNFHGMVLRLVRGKWVERIKTIQANASAIGPTSDLESFLFGTERKPLEAYRAILHDIDGSCCFYCERPIQKRSDVDHFIPWSRYPVDLGHNFVLAHPDCNLSKRDFLADVVHLRRWTHRNSESGAQLSDAFSDQFLPHDLTRTMAVARWAYSHGESSNAHVWTSHGAFRTLTEEWKDCLLSQS